MEAHFGLPSAHLLSTFFQKTLQSVFEDDTEYNDVAKRVSLGSMAAKFVTDVDHLRNEYFQNLLARLLERRCPDSDIEWFALDQLQMALGKPFTVDMSRLLEDISQSRDLNRFFKEYRSKRDKNKAQSYDYELEMIVVSAQYLKPKASSSPLALLPPLVEEDMVFYGKAFLAKDEKRRSEPKGANKSLGKKITWDRSMATADVKANFSRDGRSYVLKCPAFTAMVLLLFQNENKLSIGCIQRQTKLSATDLNSALRQLFFANILREEENRDVENTCCEVSLNFDFKSPSKVVHLDESRVAKPVLKPASDAEKQIYTEALLMRILKRSESLNCDAYIDQALKASRMDIDLDIISKSLRTLVERGYIERRGSSYHYLA
ncbi:cullin homolog 1 [Galendromus occidentalis]|uniref:Cullin homolog 1 n=1 Tax=Galendromus occidentalis TaxID=34638 RepID=A0AAJ6QSA7_9ACAR|nr:cullin homolog 1 [Galendromus occidentalis]